MLSLILLACASSSTTTTSEKKEDKTETITQAPEAASYTLRKETKRLADKVACTDLDNDGVDEQIYIHNGSIFWGENQDPLQGAFQAFHRGKERFLFATGFGKGAREAVSQLYALDSSGIQKLWERDGERNQITSLTERDGEIFLSIFTEGTMVSGGWLKEELESLGEFKMGMAQEPLGDSLVVGRLYGDQPRSFGDLRIKTGAQETFLPVFRGVKSLLVHDVNQDNILDILVSDGWHYQYASQAKGRVRAYLGPDFQDIRTLANFDQDYTVNRMEAHRNNRDYLIQAANHVYFLEQTPYGFKTTMISKILETGTAVFCYNKENTSILVSGQPAQLIHLERTQ